MDEQHDDTRETSTDDEGVEIPVNVEDDPNDETADNPGGEKASEEAERAADDEPDDVGASEDDGTDGSVEGSGDADEGGDDETATVDESDDLFVSPDDSDVEVLDEEADLDDEADLEARDVPSEEGPDREALIERIDELESTVERLKEERDDFKERMLRAAADLENYRKRAEQEKEELKKYGSKSLVKDLLSTIDNLERALEHAQSSDEANIIDGVDMVLNQIHDTFAKHGIEVFDAEGEPFDPEQHEAIQQVETTEAESGTVVEQFQRGYMLHDRLLRPAMVAVAKNPEDSKDDGAEETSEGDDAEPAEQEASPSEDAETDSEASETDESADNSAS